MLSCSLSLNAEAFWHSVVFQKHSIHMKRAHIYCKPSWSSGSLDSPCTRFYFCVNQWTQKYKRMALHIKVDSTHISLRSVPVAELSVVVCRLHSYFTFLLPSFLGHPVVWPEWLKAILCNSPNCRSVVVLQVFESLDNFVIGRIADHFAGKTGTLHFSK